MVGNEGPLYNVVRRNESLLLIGLAAPICRAAERVSPMRISVVIPAFNEAGNIGRLIEETYCRVPERLLAK